jgi:hypothetical protein
VLVIIGLLIGGVLVAQSMISSAKLVSFVRQIQQIDVAVTNFQTKYSYLPGDSPLHSAVGNGDGVIAPSFLQSAYEGGYFWPQLQAEGFMSNQPAFSNNAVAPYNKVGINVPGAALAGAGSFGPAGIDPYSNGTTNYYFVCSTRGAGLGDGNGSWYGVVTYTPIEALAVDTKMDDGLYSTGTVNGYNGISGGLGQCNNGGGDPTHYRVGYSAPDCCLMIKMMGSTGLN